MTIKRLLTFFIFLEVVSAISIAQNVFVDNQANQLIVIPAVANEMPPLISPTVTPAPTAITPVPGEFCLDVPILLYHYIKPLPLAEKLGHAALTVDSAYFDEQMKYLNEHGYRTASSEELVQALLTHTQLPPKTVLITIDDGYDDVYDYAFPIAKKYNIVLNLMIPTGLLGKPNYMTWDELKELSQSELVHIYNHTNSHAELTQLNREEKTHEVHTAKEQLSNQLGNNTVVFSYPYGSIDDESIDVVKQQGYVAGFSTKGGTEQCTSFIMTLHRTHIGNSNLDGYGF